MIAATHSLTALADLRSSSGSAEEGRRAAREFEALVLSQMLKAGSEPLFEDSPLDGGSAGRMAREQLMTALVAEATRGRGLGLAAQLEAAMRRGDAEADTGEVTR